LSDGEALLEADFLGEEGDLSCEREAFSFEIEAVSVEVEEGLSDALFLTRALRAEKERSATMEKRQRRGKTHRSLNLPQSLLNPPKSPP
jgi:hypothetical protein